MSKVKSKSFEEFMKTPSIGTRLKMLGVEKSFFTKARTPHRIKAFTETMWERRKMGIVDPNTWNEAVLVYGHLPMWTEDINPQINTDISVGEDVE